MTSGELAGGLRLLAQLCRSGMPTGRVLQVFPELAPPAWRPVAARMRQLAEQGVPVSDALAASTPNVPTFVLALLRAGERGIGLPLAFERAAQEAERVQQQREAIQQSLAYPILLLVAAVSCVALIVFVVLPRFREVLSGLGQDLPLVAALLLSSMDHVNVSIAALLFLAATIGCLLYVYRASPERQRQLAKGLLAIPGLGGIVHRLATARYCTVIAALLELKTPAATAMAIASPTLGNPELEWRAAAAREDVLNGARISHALAARVVVAPGYEALLRVGEASSAFASALHHVADVAYTDASARTRALVRIIEPALVVAIAVFVAAVAMVLLQTVYSVRPAGV
ncbi:MAG: type II secretion system F family protein [Gemmatimonadaceae bacterium]|nr:type II secretion system F family protein [Gemmatimonadaceae bacterium]